MFTHVGFQMRGHENNSTHCDHLLYIRLHVASVNSCFIQCISYLLSHNSAWSILHGLKEEPEDEIYWIEMTEIHIKIITTDHGWKYLMYCKWFVFKIVLFLVSTFFLLSNHWLLSSSVFLHINTSGNLFTDSSGCLLSLKIRWRYLVIFKLS